MARSSLHTSLVLLVALTAACGSNGSNGQSSPDAPGVPGIADPNAATQPTSDGDSDSVPADQDLCPNTPAGIAVDGNGCSAKQRATNNATPGDANGQPGGNAGSGNAGAGNAGSGDANGAGVPGSAQAIDDGTVAPNGFAVFVLDPKGAVPVTLRTLASNVENLANGGFALSGTVLIDAPNNAHITLAEAKLTLSYNANKGQGLQGFEGMVRLPIPNLGFMQGVSVDNLVYAAVGYDLGQNIKNVDAPIKADRKYLYFTFSAGFTANVGDLSISTAINQSVTMTLDPSDPSFFLKASLGGLMGPVDEASVGFSIGGHLPFTPSNTWGIDANAASFDGHLWIGGKINLNDLKLPLAIGGNTVVNLDPNADGKTLFTDPAGGFQFGSNSELDVSISAGVIGLEIPVATGTVVGSIIGKTGAAYYSGTLTAGNGWMPDAVPLKNTTQLKAAGHASTTLRDTYFKAQGDLSFDAAKLGQWTGLDLNDLAMAEASLNADQDGLTVTGTASTSISPYIGLKGKLSTVGYFNGHPKDWYVTLDGKFAVSGVELGADAHARLDQNGMAVTGIFQTPISSVSMLGSITRAGVDLEGTATVTIPIVGGKEVLQVVTNAAVCGYETVTDAAVCGTQTITDGTVCGYNTVKDATLCGTTTVRDAAQCGATTAANGAECGYHTITSAAECGASVFSDIAHCGASCIGSIFGSGSCSCSVAKSCNVASTCTFPNTCNVAATCKIGKTCDVPKSCQKVKTCETHVTVPDFNYGTFNGTVSVKIGNSGLEGGVSGQYCATGAACVTLIGGRVKVTGGTPEACVTVDGVGEVCAGF